MKIEIDTAYAPADDITFIMEYRYQENGEDFASIECVGWYAGEPNEESTKLYYGDLKATY